MYISSGYVCIYIQDMYIPSGYVHLFWIGIYIYIYTLWISRASHVVIIVKNPPDNARDLRDKGSIPGLGRSSGGGHGNPLQ